MTSQLEICLREMIYHPERSKKWMRSKLLTAVEKKILHGHMLMRDNKICDVIEEINKIPDIELNYVNDQKNLLLGRAYNNVGFFWASEKHLKLSIEGFKSRDDKYHLFLALFHLVTVFSNTGRIVQIKNTIIQMERIRLSEELLRIKLLRSKFIYACDNNNKKQADKVLAQIEHVKKHFPESDLAAQLVCEFVFYVKYEEFENAQRVLNEIKKHRKYKLSDNYRFMKILLLHYTKDITIYAYKRDFRYIPLLYHQLKVIECLHLNDQMEARRHWIELQKISPEIFGVNFKYLGGKCIFSLCLKKYLKPAIETELKGSQKHGSKYQLALRILQETNSPVKKATLYKMLYDYVPQDKNDYKKMALLIHKIRRNYRVTIVSKKETYHLIHS